MTIARFEQKEENLKNEKTFLWYFGEPGNVLLVLIVLIEAFNSVPNRVPTGRCSLLQKSLPSKE